METLVVGNNFKAVKSVNFGMSTCRPTEWCAKFCYGRGRTKEEGERLGSSANSGPVTWPVQQACYERNVDIAKALFAGGHDAMTVEAQRIAKSARRRKMMNLRWNGTGDLFPEVLPLLAHIAACGVKVWGFSRKPECIRELARLCSLWGVATQPYFLGSVDPTTSAKEAAQLAVATGELNGEYTLAYATASAGSLGRLEVESHPMRASFKVVFGYHTNKLHTVLGHVLECPSTGEQNNTEGYCQECRRCMGES